MDEEPITASDYFQKGVEYLQNQQFDKALECVNNAIARNYFGGDIALVKGEILFELKRHDEALEWFNRAPELDNSLAAEATLWKGRVFFEKQQFGRALSAFNRVIDMTPMPGDAYLNKGMVLCERGDFLKAIEALDEARGLIGDSDDKLAEILFWQGRSLRGLRRDGEAAATLEKVIGLTPDFVEAYVELGELYRSQGQLGKACEIYTRGLKEFPNDPSIANDYGNALRDLGKLDESLEQLSRAVKFDGPTSVAVYNRALTFERMNRWDDALADYAAVVNANPRDIDARLRRLDLLARQDRFAEAFKELDTFDEDERGVPEVQEGIARLFNRQVRILEIEGKASDVLAMYQLLLKVHPDFLDLDNPGKQYESSRERHERILALLESIKPDDANADLLALLRAVLYAKIERRAESLEYLERAKAGPFPEVAWLLYADIMYYDLQDPEQALKAVDKALEMRPEFIAALWLKVAVLYEGLRDFDGAINIYRRVLDISHDNPAVLHALGEVYLDHGQPFRALMCFRRMVSLSPGDSAMQRELAQCYLALGRTVEAVAELERLRANNEGDLELTLDLSEAMIRGGRREEARLLIERVMAENKGLSPSVDASSWELLSELANMNRMYDEALTWLDRIDNEELSSLGMLQKGIALAGLGKTDVARESFEELCAERGAETREGRKGRIELAKLLRARGERDRARLLIEEALDGAPYHWRTRALLVWVLREMGESDAAEAQERLITLHRDLEPGMRFMSTEEYADAADEFRRLSGKYQGEADVSYWLAAAQCMAGQYDGAALSLRHAISIEPGLADRARLDPFFDEFAFSELQAEQSTDDLGGS
ncbi:MAG: tetratricopeptide repeat protein [Planctomycetaceae bacterium]|nr:tetratricopeptide repeat protein [Planctomycetaceae bacterium]